jgi:hypothetical protein
MRGSSMAVIYWRGGEVASAARDGVSGRSALESAFDELFGKLIPERAQIELDQPFSHQGKKHRLRRPDRTAPSIRQFHEEPTLLVGDIDAGRDSHGLIINRPEWWASLSENSSAA